MSLRLTKPERSLSQLKALAASGSSSFAKRAQEELRAHVADQLRRELGQ